MKKILTKYGALAIALMVPFAQAQPAKFQAASEFLYRTSMKVTSALSVLPPLMEFIGGVAFAVAPVRKGNLMKAHAAAATDGPHRLATGTS